MCKNLYIFIQNDVFFGAKDLHISDFCCIFVVGFEKAMKVKWTSIIDEMQGSVDAKHYARHIPGNGEYAAVCMKPELSKKTKKKKAAHPTCKSFSNCIGVCQEIYADAERKALWEARYEEAKHKARRHGKFVQGRFVDYLRHEVSEALKRGEEIA